MLALSAMSVIIIGSLAIRCADPSAEEISTFDLLAPDTQAVRLTVTRGDITIKQFDSPPGFPPPPADAMQVNVTKRSSADGALSDIHVETDTVGSSPNVELLINADAGDFGLVTCKRSDVSIGIPSVMGQPLEIQVTVDYGDITTTSFNLESVVDRIVLKSNFGFIRSDNARVRTFVVDAADGLVSINNLRMDSTGTAAVTAQQSVSIYNMLGNAGNMTVSGNGIAVIVLSPADFNGQFSIAASTNLVLNGLNPGYFTVDNTDWRQTKAATGQIGAGGSQMLVVDFDGSVTLQVELVLPIEPPTRRALQRRIDNNNNIINNNNHNN